MCRCYDVAGENGYKTLFVKRMEGIFASLCRPHPPWAGRCTNKRFAWPWQRPAMIVMGRYCNVVGENGCKTLFVQRMEGNFRFTMQPSAGPGDAPTSTSSGLGGGQQSLQCVTVAR